jgi:hypothetical protein
LSPIVVVQHRRRVVEDPPEAMAAEVAHHRERGLPRRLDRAPDVAEALRPGRMAAMPAIIAS